MNTIASVLSIVQNELEDAGEEENFTYGKTPLASMEIRILVLQPISAEGASIQCHLVRLSLNTATAKGLASQPYMALSYVWGPSEPKKYIEINGKQMSVTPNLFAALSQLRQIDRPIPLWIDAICIDQGNIAERNQQVTLMGQIYSQASTVLLWMGPSELPKGEDGGRRGDERQDHVGIEFLARVLDEWLHLAEGGQRVSYLNLLKADLERGESVIHSGLLNFFRSEYWTRMWILQEVVLSKKPFLVSGPYMVNFKNLVPMIRSMGLLSIHKHILRAQEPFNQVSELYNSHQEGKRASLLGCLLRSRQRFASRREDYFYSVLGIVDLMGRRVIVDYHRPVASIFAEVVRLCIELEKNLDVLSVCQNLSPSAMQDALSSWVAASLHIEADWPSWIPDWSFKPKPQENVLDMVWRIFDPRHNKGPEKISSILLAREENSAQFRTTGDTKPEPIFSDDAKFLTLKGAIFDKIEIAGSTPAESDDEWISTEEWQSFVSHAQTRNVYGDEKAQLDAFEKTKACGGSSAWEDNGDSFFGPGIFEYEDTSEMSRSQYLTRNPESMVMLKPFRHKSRFFVTAQGYVGRGPTALQVGDKVCTFLGAKVPFVLREDTSDGQYHLLGDSYVYGIMDGSAMPLLSQKLQEVVLK